MYSFLERESYIELRFLTLTKIDAAGIIETDGNKITACRIINQQALEEMT